MDRMVVSGSVLVSSLPCLVSVHDSPHGTAQDGLHDSQWRSEGGAGGGICPRAPPGGGRQNPAKYFLKNYIRRNLIILKEKKLKCSHFSL